MPHRNPGIGLPFDPDSALRLLQEAGIDPATIPPIRIVYNTDQTHRLVAQNVQKQWQSNLGVTVEIESREWKVFLKELTVRPPAVYRLGWGADYPDPDNFMSLFASYSANNHSRWGSPRYDRLVERAAREPDPNRRQPLYDEAQRILCEQDVPIVPLFVTAINLLVSERVEGFRANPMDLIFLDGVRAR
jgi:oligopeptide transport system substrate-binding protein